MLVFHSGTSLINTKKRRFVHILPSIGAKSLFFPFHYVADQYSIVENRYCGLGHRLGHQETEFFGRPEHLGVHELENSVSGYP